MEETVNRLIDELGPVSEKLGEGAEHVYRLAVRQAVINGVTDLVIAIVLVGVTFGLYRGVLYAIERNKENDYSAWDIVAAIYGLAGAVTGFVALGHVIIGLRQLLNPEFAAIQLILHSVVG